MDGVSLRTFGAEDAAWLIALHRDLYAREAGFDASFGALVSGIVDDFLATHDPARERGILAVMHDRRLGSIFCVRGDGPGVAKLRLFLLCPEARGLGIGQRLLEGCLDFARAAGYRQIRLRTHESHRAACALYARNGFARTASRPVRSFGQDLVEETFERPL